jgi:outer membrane receptor protein involved in Fe transport
VASGAIDRFGSVEPTEGGRSSRENLLLDGRWAPSAGDTWEVDAWGTRYKLRLWSDFTFFANSGLPSSRPRAAPSDRPADEDDRLQAEGYFLLDLLPQYRWRNLELGVQVLNLTNTEWEEVQFEDDSCVLGQEQGADPDRPCFAKPGGSAVTPPGVIHFTPGNPIGVLAGLTLFF